MSRNEVVETEEFDDRVSVPTRVAVQQAPVIIGGAEDDGEPELESEPAAEAVAAPQPSAVQHLGAASTATEVVTQDPDPAPAADTRPEPAKVTAAPAEPPRVGGAGGDLTPPVVPPTAEAAAEPPEDDGQSKTPAAAGITLPSGDRPQNWADKVVEVVGTRDQAPRNPKEYITVTVKSLSQLADMYREELVECERLLPHPLSYRYAARLTPEAMDVQLTRPALLGDFYGPAREVRRGKIIDDLANTMIQAVRERDPSVEDTVNVGTTMLQHTYKLTEAIKAVYDSKATFAMDHFPGPHRTAALRSLGEINAMEKPPVIAAFMCRDIPHFAWDTQPLPDMPIPAGYEDRMRELWSGYTYRDAAYLAQPAELAEGRAPFHMAIRAADTAQAEGHTDFGYSLKTATLLHTYDAERARFAGDTPEMPFYHYILPAAIAGTTVPAPRSAHFDYQAAISDVMDETWDRVAAELQSGQAGPGQAFMSELTARYGDALAPYLARSIMRHANESSFDIVETLGNLQTGETPWAAALTEQVLELPQRPLMTNEEVGNFAELALPEAATEPLDQAALSAAAEALGETADIYSFKVPLLDVGAETKGVSATATIDIDAAAMEAQATLRYRANGTRHILPLTIDLAEGTVDIKTIDAGGLDPAIAERFRELIGKAIQAEKARLDETAADSDQAAGIGIASRTPTTAQPGTTLDDDRGPKVKTRGEAGEQHIDETTDLPADDETRGHISLSGLDPDVITDMLKSQGIAELDAGTVIKKVQGLAASANLGDRSFGKRPAIGWIKGGDQVKLRQVNWIVGGGHRQIRVYFKEGAGGRLEFCGIYNKKNPAHQRAYLEKLIKRLAPPEQRGRRR